MPIVRVLNTMFRPFMQRISAIQACAAGQGAEAQAGALVGIANEFGNFMQILFNSILGEALKTLNNIVWAVAETLTTAIAVFAVFVARLLGGEQAANAMAQAFGGIIAGMDFARQAINSFIDYGLDVLIQSALGADPMVFVDLATGFTDLVQGVVLSSSPTSHPHQALAFQTSSLLAPLLKTSSSSAWSRAISLSKRSPSVRP
jgi:hypothetical protein